MYASLRHHLTTITIYQYISHETRLSHRDHTTCCNSWHLVNSCGRSFTRSFIVYCWQGSSLLWTPAL